MADLLRVALPAKIVARAVLRHGLWPLAIGVAVATLAVQQSRPPDTAGAEANLPLLLWLHVPLLLICAHCLLATLAAWPLLARDLAGTATLRRLCPDRWAGCLSAWCGGVGTAALLGATAGALFAMALHWLRVGTPAPRGFTAATAVQVYGAIDARCAELQFNTRAHADAVRLNPWVALQADATFTPVEVEVAVNGQVVAPSLLVGGNGEQHLVPLPAATTVTSVTVRRRSAPTLTLLWPVGSVELRGAQPHTLVGNLALAGVCYALAVGVVLAACCALRRVLSRAAMTIFALAGLLVAVLGELTPQTTALTTCARGRSLLAHWPAPWLALAIIAVALALAWRTGTKRPA